MREITPLLVVKAKVITEFSVIIVGDKISSFVTFSLNEEAKV